MSKERKQSTEAAVREIRRRTRRKFSPEEKIRIVLEGLRGEQSSPELCRREGILRLSHPTECVMDRLTWYFHDSDRQCFEQAIQVARHQSIDLRRIEGWARRERPHRIERFREFEARLGDRESG